MTAASNSSHVALVTGAARRVGRAVALELARAGYDIVVHYHLSEQSANQTAQDVQQLGRRAILVRGDLRDPAVPEQMIDQVMGQWKRIDVLVNNAAIFETMSLEEFSLPRWQMCMQINLAAPIELCRQVAPLMRKHGGGCIVNFCDIATDRPWKDYLSYGPSKAGLDYVTQSLAKALAPTIRVNGVAPGIAVFPESYSASQKKQLVEKVPLGRAGTPEAVAKTVRFLIESDYITGQIIKVDGGRSINGENCLFEDEECDT